MQTMLEWMQAHNYNCPSALAFAEDYTDVAHCWDTTGNIDYMLIGAWEQAMDGLWDGGREYIVSWVDAVVSGFPDLAPGDMWPVGAIPDNMGRFEFYDTARELARSIMDRASDPRFAGTVASMMCQMLRDIVPFNPMQNAP